MATYKFYLNGRCYGGGPPAYMTELFRDYVEYCEMYGKESIEITIVNTSKKKAIE